ncbi:hypothetical protein CLOSTHATH_06875 [Hungatella hathewayi DSM 13479]|uniref:Uncharacterized protein n=1 Tax=Hungatella hathewayi DSM 13479 TaxID=566550 RepID=D3ATB5_9FIRM|nr:hypothetical protein CLOSTHATH_06875 [Hungatella hathewayi DSM 13479]
MTGLHFSSQTFISDCMAKTPDAGMADCAFSSLFSFLIIRKNYASV